MDNYSFVELACIGMIVIPGLMVVVGILVYGLCKYGGRESDDWLDEYP